MSAPVSIPIRLPDEAATMRLAEDVAMKMRAGDVIALYGDLGAGKSSFARALIRAVADDPELEVPSPTFTLVQTYATRVPIAHFDLYRLGSADEMDEIGFDEAVGDGAVLVEWPERAGDRLPEGRLELHLSIEGSGRIATLVAAGSWPERLIRTATIRAFLNGAGWSGAVRRYLQGDASYRAYERVRGADGSPTAILMDAPSHPAPTGGYDATAHRATEVRPFIAMGAAIRAIGLSAPELLAADVGEGLLLVEDLGSGGVLRDGAPDPERYARAVDVLATIHAEPRPRVLPLPAGGTHAIPPFDRDCLMIEVDQLVSWAVKDLDSTVKARFVAIWRRLFERFDAAEKSWVLRDYHSPNLIWLSEREGLAQVGLIDYQDAMIGPAAYDVASLAQDVRVTIPPALETALKQRYVAARRAQGDFDAMAFEEAYAISAAQKATKLLGAFRRLEAAGKSQYVRHIPRIESYLIRVLGHPVLAELADWYRLHRPLGDAPSRQG